MDYMTYTIGPASSQKETQASRSHKSGICCSPSTKSFGALAGRGGLLEAAIGGAGV
jgi:hypothetical protein